MKNFVIYDLETAAEYGEFTANCEDDLFEEAIYISVEHGVHLENVVIEEVEND